MKIYNTQSDGPARVSDLAKRIDPIVFEREYAVYIDPANYVRRSRHRLEDGSWSPWHEERTGVYFVPSFDWYKQRGKTDGPD